jgi:hypothetical protein
MNGGIFLYRHLGLDFMFFILYFFIRRPSDSTVVEEVGFKPRTFATLALEIRPSNPQSRQSSSPPPWFRGGGGGHIRLRERGWGVPIRTRGQTLCYSRYICTSCSNHSAGVNVIHHRKSFSLFRNSISLPGVEVFRNKRRKRKLPFLYENYFQLAQLSITA